MVTYSRCNQLIDIARQSTEQTARPKDGIRKEQTPLPAKDIAQLAVQRLERGQSEEIRGRNPAGQIESLEVASNLTVTGHDNSLVRSR